MPFSGVPFVKKKISFGVSTFGKTKLGKNVGVLFSMKLNLWGFIFTRKVICFHILDSVVGLWQIQIKFTGVHLTLYLNFGAEFL